MNLTRFARLAAFLLTASLSIPAFASPLEDAAAAYTKGDYATALRLWRGLAEQGDAKAQFSLGVMYETGRGVAKDDAEAVQWYRKAAEQGNAVAQGNLGLIYANSRGVTKDDAEAVRWFRKAAEQGDALGQNNLGYAYANGRGVAKDDAQAVEWYRKAAEQGSAEAQDYLGLMYASGRGVDKDGTQAVQWFRKAADQGYAASQLNIAYMYETHRAVATDDAEVLQWYRKAAERGDAGMQTNVGIMYFDGRGAPRDKAEAEMWFRRAAEQGDVRARIILDSVDAKEIRFAESHRIDDSVILGPQRVKEVAISGCTRSILINQELDYLARQNIHREQLPPDFRKEISRAMGIPGICECVMGRISSLDELEYLNSHPAEFVAKMDPCAAKLRAGKPASGNTAGGGTR